MFSSISPFLIVNLLCYIRDNFLMYLVLLLYLHIIEFFSLKHNFTSRSQLINVKYNIKPIIYNANLLSEKSKIALSSRLQFSVN